MQFELKNIDIDKNMYNININWENIDDKKEKEKLIYKYLDFLKSKADINGKIDEDLLQEFVEIMLTKAVDTYNGTTKFSTWLNYVLESHKSNYCIKEKRRKHIKLDQNISEGITLKDILSSDFDVENEVINNELYKFIEKELTKMNKKHKIIINNYFGFGDYELKTLDEIANMFGYSQPYITQEKNKVLNYLNKKMEWEGII
ncbi:MAG: sigma-70 family RNA polymerase sigma factor [Bacillota bacterium]